MCLADNKSLVYRKWALTVYLCPLLLGKALCQSRLLGLFLSFSLGVYVFRGLDFTCCDFLNPAINKVCRSINSLPSKYTFSFKNFKSVDIIKSFSNSIVLLYAIVLKCD